MKVEVAKTSSNILEIQGEEIEESYIWQDEKHEENPEPIGNGKVSKSKNCPKDDGCNAKGCLGYLQLEPRISLGSKVDNSLEDSNEDDEDEEEEDPDAFEDDSELLEDEIISCSVYQVWRHNVIYDKVFESLCNKKLFNS